MTRYTLIRKILFFFRYVLTQFSTFDSYRISCIRYYRRDLAFVSGEKKLVDNGKSTACHIHNCRLSERSFAFLINREILHSSKATPSVVMWFSLSMREIVSFLHIFLFINKFLNLSGMDYSYLDWYLLNL